MTSPKGTRAQALADEIERLNQAAYILRHYAGVVSACHSSELERFEYLPAIEAAAEAVEGAALRREPVQGVRELVERALTDEVLDTLEDDVLVSGMSAWGKWRSGIASALEAAEKENAAAGNGGRNLVPTLSQESPGAEHCQSAAPEQGSDTPLTDARVVQISSYLVEQLYGADFPENREVVCAPFVRSLERRLHEAGAEVQKLRIAAHLKRAEGEESGQ